MLQFIKGVLVIVLAFMLSHFTVQKQSHYITIIIISTVILLLFIQLPYSKHIYHSTCAYVCLLLIFFSHTMPGIMYAMLSSVWVSVDWLTDPFR